MNAFDKFIIGDTESIDWCFENTHFNQRLTDNSISRDFIVKTLKYEEPLRYEKSGHNEYSVIYRAPPSKKYDEIKVIMACNGNSIDLVTIMPNATTNRQRNLYKSTEFKNLEKKRLNAISKRRNF